MKKVAVEGRQMAKSVLPSPSKSPCRFGVVTSSVAVLLGLPAVGVCVVVTPEVVFDWTPAVLLVTAKVTLQLPPAGMVMPLKLRLLAPALKLLGVIAPQVLVTAPPLALIFASVSVKEAFVSAIEALLLESKSVTVEVPPA